MDIFTSSDSEFEFQFEIDDKEYLDVIAEIEDKTSDTGEDAVKIKPKCTICNKEFARKYNLERHLMIHQASRCYICEICGKTIRGAISLHQKTHSDFKAFSCKTCGKQFRQKLGLKCHEMVIIICLTLNTLFCCILICYLITFILTPDTFWNKALHVWNLR